MTVLELVGLFMLFMLVIWPVATYVADAVRYVWGWVNVRLR